MLVKCWSYWWLNDVKWWHCPIFCRCFSRFAMVAICLGWCHLRETSWWPLSGLLRLGFCTRLVSWKSWNKAAAITRTFGTVKNRQIGSNWRMILQQKYSFDWAQILGGAFPVKIEYRTVVIGEIYVYMHIWYMIYTNIHIHTYIHTYIYIYIYTYIHTNIGTFLRTLFLVLLGGLKIIV